VFPLIGITSAEWANPQTGAPYNRMYKPVMDGVVRAGGLPVMIPTALDEQRLHQLYALLHGLLLPGGVDVDPTHFNEDRHPRLGMVDAGRDQVELPLARWAVADDLPVFGICRGHQVLNVALGGTLVQDIPSQLDTDIAHDQPDEEPRDRRAHPVQIEAGSRLATLLGTTQVAVNSLHHQSVGTPAPGVRVSALSPDGIVEALEVPQHPFALSVQWHPEDMAADDPMMQRLFDEFVAAARARMLQSQAR
jgi:putative glutamine amidotransferase